MRLIGEERTYDWAFGSGVTVIAGPVGTGKTSLLELIKFGLGGNGTLTKAVRTVGREVGVEITAGEQRLTLVRGLAHRPNQVEVRDEAGALISALSARSTTDQETVSSLLMSALTIPQVRVPTSRRRPRARFTRISFAAVFAYMYLEQREIDRSIVDHLDPMRDPKRRSTFELLYGLVNAEIADRQVALAEVEDAIARAETSVPSASSFTALWSAQRR